MHCSLALAVMSVAVAQSTLDLTHHWRFRPDPECVGVGQSWHEPGFDDQDWATLEAGANWEEQGYPNVDGHAWYRKSLDIPVEWKGQKVWLVLGGVNDAFTVYCNGHRAGTFGDLMDHSMTEVPAMVELSSFITYGQSNLLAVDCLDWGGRGGLWRLPCLVTTDTKRLPLDAIVSCLPEYENSKLLVGVNTQGLGVDACPLVVQLRAFKGQESIPMHEALLTIEKANGQAMVRIGLGTPKGGDRYRIAVKAHTTAKPSKGLLDTDMDITWPDAPSWDGEYAGLKVRNNFVTELLTVTVDGARHETLAFPNPRDGWVLISATSSGEDGPVVRLDGEPRPIHWRRHPTTGALEGMRRLSAGRHALEVESSNRCDLVVRTVPELMYCYYPASPHIASFGPYDWPYVSRHVLPHVNTLITSGRPAPSEVEEWLEEGRAWVANAGLPGLSDSDAPTAEEVYETWAGNPGVTESHFSGMIVDEFLNAGQGHYRAWTEAMTKLRHDPAFAGRTFYAWCGDIHRHEPSLEFRRRVKDFGYRFAWEKYLPEAPDEMAAMHSIAKLERDLEEWKATMPDVAERLVMTLGYLCAPPESQNLDPAVDYQVFMDMQFHRLATEPAFWRLYGVMEYSASYADEESLRWAHQIFRHYCIEGRRDRMTHDPYQLRHIANPDFLSGLDGWQVHAATEDSVASSRMEGFSWLQGRYPKTAIGDQFCRMIRSQERPNRVSQTIRALEPGRLYSVKLIGSTLELMDSRHETTLRVNIAGAETVLQWGFINPYPSNYAHEFGPYNREHPAWFTFQRVVFRAAAKTAELTISDWATDDTPGAPAGETTAFNFVEVQPFRAP